MKGLNSNKSNTTVINNYYGGSQMGQMGMGMGQMGGPMQMMMQMMQQMMQMMSGGGCSPCMQGQYPGMQGMGNGMPGMMNGMNGGMPDMSGMNGMGGMPSMGGCSGMGNGMPGMGDQSSMMMGAMMGMMMGSMLSGFMGNIGPSGNFCCPPPQQNMNTGMANPASMANGPRPMGRGGLRIEGDKVMTPGGYSVAYKGTDVTIEGMNNKNKGQEKTQNQKQGGTSAAFAYSGPNGSFAAAFSSGGGMGMEQMGGPQATGKTRVWGDPHVEEGDGQKWDWKDKTMSFNLPDGTKVTMNAESANGTVQSVDVYNGNDHVSGSGGQWQGDMKSDGMRADAQQADGTSVFAGRNGDVSNWYSNPFGQGQEISQQYKK